MPKFAPHTLPKDASRPQSSVRPTQDHPVNQSAHPAIVLGQHIRRERGMHGVRGFAATIRDYLSEEEYRELCSAMGVPTNLSPPAANTVKHEAPPPPPSNSGNQMQALSMLAQLMGNQGGSVSGNPLSALMGNHQGGINPAMLSQLLGGGQAAVGGGGGIDPMMLAQLLGGLGK